MIHKRLCPRCLEPMSRQSYYLYRCQRCQNLYEVVPGRDSGELAPVPVYSPAAYCGRLWFGQAQHS